MFETEQGQVCNSDRVERSGVKANSAAATAGDAVICPIDSDGERGRGVSVGERIDR